MQPDEYRKLAEVEDSMWYFRALQALVRPALADLPAAGVRLLDAGCGTGGLILRLRAGRPEWRYSGIDFSPLAVDLARQRCGPGVDLREASITALPFPDASFDAVVSADVVCQVDDAPAAVREFARVLRPGGLVVINVPAHRWLWSYHDETCQTKHRYTRPEMSALLAAAGFGGSRLTHWNMLALPLILAKRKLLPGRAGDSDVKAYPGAVEAVFLALAAAERQLIRRRLDLPLGSSVFAVARRQAALP